MGAGYLLPATIYELDSPELCGRVGVDPEVLGGPPGETVPVVTRSVGRMMLI